MEKVIVLQANWFCKCIGLLFFYMVITDASSDFKILGVYPDIFMTVMGVMMFFNNYKISHIGIDTPLFFSKTRFTDTRVFKNQNQIVIEIDGGIVKFEGTTIMIPMFLQSNYSGLLLFLDHLRNEKSNIYLGRNIENDLSALKAKMKLKEEKRRLKQKTEFL